MTLDHGQFVLRGGGVMISKGDEFAFIIVSEVEAVASTEDYKNRSIVYFKSGTEIEVPATPRQVVEIMESAVRARFV